MRDEFASGQIFEDSAKCWFTCKGEHFTGEAARVLCLDRKWKFELPDSYLWDYLFKDPDVSLSLTPIHDDEWRGVPASLSNYIKVLYSEDGVDGEEVYKLVVENRDGLFLAFEYGCCPSGFEGHCGCDFLSGTYSRSLEDLLQFGVSEDVCCMIRLHK